MFRLDQRLPDQARGFFEARGFDPAVTVQPLTALPDRPNAPDFVLSDYDGAVHKLAYYPRKIVIVNFWATWCPPRRDEMPAMQRAWEAFREEDIVLLAVNVGEDEDSIFAFTASYPVEFPLLMDSDSSVIRQWPVRGPPTTFVLDSKGRLAFRALGGRAWDDPELMIQIRTLK